MQEKIFLEKQIEEAVLIGGKELEEVVSTVAKMTYSTVEEIKTKYKIQQ